MDAAILVIGDEVLAGRTQDTNSHYLARRLTRLGVRLIEICTVADDDTAIQAAAWELHERRHADLVITSGGLGPTHDDRTVKAVANLHGLPLVQDDATWKRITERAAELHAQGKRSRPDPGPGAHKTALVPQGATTLTNPAGAAPGLLLERRVHSRDRSGWMIVLPGVPEELRAVWTAHAEPWLAGKIGETTPPVTKRWETHGQESELAPHLNAVEQEHPDVRVGSYPGWGTTRVVLTITGPAQPVEAASRTLRHHLDTIGIHIEALANMDEEA